MMHTISNECLSVRVADVGAELCGIYSHETQQEYLFQPGHEIWEHSNLLLFPNPGRIADARAIIDGKVYPAMMHGFACKQEFAVIEHGPDRIVLELQDNATTRYYYPYAFCLRVELVLEGEKLHQHIHVINRDEKPLYYCLGAHPAFYCPLEVGGKAEDCYLEFDRPQSLRLLHMQENTRLLTGEETPYLEGTRIPLGDHFFDDGPKLLGGMNAETLRLGSVSSERFVEMSVKGFPNLCLWGVPTRMSIIAIEPWHCPNDRADTNHIWEEKPGIQTIPTAGSKTHTFTFRVG